MSAHAPPPRVIAKLTEREIREDRAVASWGGAADEVPPCWICGRLIEPHELRASANVCADCVEGHEYEGEDE